MTANQTWIDGGRGIKDVTRLVACNILAWAGLTALLVIGFLVAALGGATGCSHLPSVPDLPAITNAIPDLPGTPTTTTTTTTTTVPPAAGGYTITKASTSGVSWKGPCPAWKDVNGCIGEVHLYYVAGANGRHDGKFDHFRKYNGSYSRDFKNIAGGYRFLRWVTPRGWTVPAKGEMMRLEMVSYDGKTRIVVGTFPWGG